MSGVEIICSACGADALLTREPAYQGLSKIGERLICSNCSFEYVDEESIPFKDKPADPALFTEADRSVKVEVFDPAENAELCRYCAHYIVNPFTQFCAIHKKEVAATDTCPEFEKAESKDTTDDIL